VRGVREQRGLSQIALGYRAHIHRNYVSLIERGKCAPTLGTIGALADALDLMPSALLARAEREAGLLMPPVCPSGLGGFFLVKRRRT
jgi:transcriptional regulator with XRE-family HTH domain